MNATYSMPPGPNKARSPNTLCETVGFVTGSAEEEKSLNRWCGRDGGRLRTYSFLRRKISRGTAPRLLRWRRYRGIEIDT